MVSLRSLSLPILLWCIIFAVPQLSAQHSEIQLNQDYADYILYNGTIISVNDNFTQYEAMAIQNNLIQGLGDDEMIIDEFALEEQTQLVDLNGKAILPGLIDSHSHMFDLSRFNEHGIDGSQELALSYGWTTIVEKYAKEDVLTMVQSFADNDQLNIRINMFASYNEASLDENNETIILESRFPHNAPILDHDLFFRIPGIKIFSDGTFGPDRGAWAVSQPLPESDMNGWLQDITSNPYGDLYLEESNLTEIISQAQNMGYQVAFHSMGDRAIETVVNAVENVTMGDNSEFRHMIEHNSYLRNDLMERYVDLGMYASVRGIFPVCSQDEEVAGNFFADNYFNTTWYSNRYAMVEQGVNVFLETDFSWTHPIGDRTSSLNLDPFLNIHGLVTRSQVAEDGSICQGGEWLHPDGIPIEEALKLITIRGAEAIRMDEYTGSLEPGKFADFVVIPTSPLDLPSEDLMDLYAILTVVNGEVMYERDDSDLAFITYQNMFSSSQSENFLSLYQDGILMMTVIPVKLIRSHRRKAM